MAAVNRKQLLEGDWVTGASMEDEKIIGYVESVDLSGLVKVRVTQSDHDGAVGRLVEAKLSKIHKLPDYEPADPADIRDLTELALMTRDRAWFEELVAAKWRESDAAIGGLNFGSAGKYRAAPSGGKRVNID